MQQPMQQRMSIRSARPITTSANAIPTVAKPSISAARPLQRPVSQVSKSKPLRLQLEQLKAKIQAFETKRKQTLSPLYRQGIDSQLNALQKQIQTVTLSLHQVQSQERLQAWESVLALVKSPTLEMATWANLKDQWYALYPPETQVFLDTSKNQIFRVWHELLLSALQALSQSQSITPAADWSLPEPLNEAAAGLLATEQAHWREWLGLLQTYLPAPVALPAATPVVVEPTAQPDNTDQMISFDQPIKAATEAPVRPDSQVSNAQKSGAELEVRFDMGSGRSLVRNSMGIVLNQEKKSYQEYLDRGFACIDQVVESGFVVTTPLQEAIEVFLEAISLNKERHEAYFGLGYLYSLVRDLNHSLYFLNLAWRISKNPAIDSFMQKVKESYGLA